jgi:hypothetical protein
LVYPFRVQLDAAAHERREVELGRVALVIRVSRAQKLQRQVVEVLVRDRLGVVDDWFDECAGVK